MGYGKKITALLQKHHISVAELSRRTHIKPTTLYSIIDNDNADLKISIAQSIANAIGISFYEFTGIPMTTDIESLVSLFPGAEISSRNGKPALKLANLKELSAFFSLNQKGKERALLYIDDLNKIPEYTQNLDSTTE